MSGQSRQGFTLVEILIVVVILGVLAAVVIPLYSSGTRDAQSVALAQDLRILQRFILMYKGQHNEIHPGYPNGDTGVNPTQAAFYDQALKASNDIGETADSGTAGYERGPYLQKIPMNPINGLATIQILGAGENFPDAADNSHGWIYKAATGEFRADCMGEDAKGISFYAY